ncbi:MAG TPA: DEAD/DEAH box helicase [Caulobacterales bacterium]|nr:DEAD/DEAH box helicase [Caulobacterales bacterium]
MTSFSDLGVAEGLLKALAAEGYDAPTAIQTQAIPYVLQGRDLIGLAQTGTGKTAAFALPILQKLSANYKPAGHKSVRALVLAPTRELAAQIAASFRTYGRFVGIGAQVVFGGVPIGKQINALQRGADVLVATPGRLLDLVQQRAVRLENVEILVLDEADHMMDMGFIVPLNKIVKLLPRARQTLFFSATMPKEIADLAQAYVREPVRVEAQRVASAVTLVDQSVIHVDQKTKARLLIDLLKDPKITRAMVFARTKHGANKLVEQLEEARIPAEAIHGNKSQGQRTRALENFKSGKARLLVATDIAARGIDVDDVSHVFNYDLPDVPEAYVHRIGRTARAGATGIAIAFCAGDERGNLRDIERLTKQPVPVRAHAMGLPTPTGEAGPARKPGPHRGAQGHGHKPNGQKPGGRSNRPFRQKRPSGGGQSQQPKRAGGRPDQRSR